MYVELNAQRYPLSVGQFYMFGKQTSTLDDDGQKNFIRVNEKEIDEKHCCISDSGDEGIFILDLLSKHGTFLNETRIKALRKIHIKHGDVVRLGSMISLKIFNDHLETSHDSSGYGEINKNTSDIICSSPETTSQRDNRLKRLNSNISLESKDDTEKFAVPAVPSSISSRNVRISDENEKYNKNRSSLGRHSDSFTIPETQYARPRSSTASNLSIAESDAGGESTKSGFNLDSFGINGCDDDDDDFCIPETQEVLQRNPVTHIGKEKKTFNALKTLEEKSVDLKDSDDDEEADGMDGSQFRICTQDYNEGFGEENNESLCQSQIIPFIKHTMPFFDSNNAKERVGDQNQNTEKENYENPMQEDDEMANVNWNPKVAQEEQPKNVPSSCSTPDLFEFAAFDAEGKTTANEDGEDGGNEDLFEDNGPATLEDAEDFMATQMFPSRSGSSSDKSKISEKGKLPKEKDILSGKDDEPYITLSDKENLHPDALEPVTDIPPRQLFATREVSNDRQSASTSQSRIGINQTSSIMPSIEISAANTSKSNNSATLVQLPPTDEEDDILTQAFPQPSKTTLSSKNNCFNSTLLDDKSIGKNPAAFFADMEKTPNKKGSTSSNHLEVFKMPETNVFTSVKKTSSVASTTSISSDLDMLMCTPQLIKDHLHLSNKPDDLRKNILAAKHKNLFGNDDSTEGEDDDDADHDQNSKDKCLVQLINVPKDSKDFDQLLPHLRKDESPSSNKKQNEEQKTPNEAYKEYQFNLCFGRDQEKTKKTVKKTSTQSRDERHSARDKQRELQQEKRSRKSENMNADVKAKRSSRRGRHEEGETDSEAKGDGKQNNEGNEKEEKAKDITQEEKKDKSKAKRKTKDNASEEKSKKAKKKIEEREEKPAEQSHESNEGEEINTRLRRGRKRKVSTEIIEVDTKGTPKDNPVVRVSRLKSTSSETNELPAKVRKGTSVTTENKLSVEGDKKSSNTPESVVMASKSIESIQNSNISASSDCIIINDELDLVPTQPLLRTTRKSSRHKPPPPENPSTSSKKTPVSRSTSPNSSLNRSSSRLSNVLTSESTAKGTKTSKSSAVERKRKEDDDAAIEGKRLRRTVSLDSKASSKSTVSTPSICLISTTMVDPLKFRELAQAANGLWAVAKDPSDSSILVTDNACRTFKFLLAMARGIPIVTSEWLQKVNEMKSVKKVQYQKYLFTDKVFEKKHKFSLVDSLKMAKENRIFQGLQFILTGKIQPQPMEIKVIIECAGGCVLRAPPSKVNENQKMYLVSTTDDRKEWHKFRRINKNIIIISTEAIMTSIMRQNIAPLSSYIIS